jgi:hypothetical protein
MGTSQSKPPAKGGSPLVPSWANQDPPPAAPADGSASSPQQQNLPAQPLPQQNSPAAPPPDLIQPRRHAGFRSSLKRFMASGDKADAQRALGHYARGSAGGGAAGGARVARSARVGGAAISALSSMVSGVTVAPNGFNLASLSGVPVAVAVAAIVDAFCPPGIIDEDLLRAAMGEALTEAFDGLDNFDPVAVDDYAIVVATRVFIAELVFNTISAEQGQAAENTPPLQAVERENELRDMIREVTDVVATPIIQAAGSALSQNRVSQLVQTIVTHIFEEMSEW